MVQIMRKLIEAERLGNWYLHLQAVSKKATIVSCVKSARICLNAMRILHRAHTAVYQHFEY